VKKWNLFDDLEVSRAFKSTSRRYDNYFRK